MKPKTSLAKNAVIAFLASSFTALVIIGTFYELPIALSMALISGLIAALFACIFTLCGQVSALRDQVAQLEASLHKRR